MSLDRQREPLPESTFFSLVSVICALMFAVYFIYNYAPEGSIATGPAQSQSSAVTTGTVTR